MNLRDIIEGLDLKKEFEEMQRFSSVTDYVLRNKNRKPEQRNWLAMQFKLRLKAKDKHPDFYKKSAVFTEKAIQQSTSDSIAQYKANRIGIGLSGKVIDLTGGMGAETLAFAQQGARVSYVEPDVNLFEVSHYNFSLFLPEVSIELYPMTAEEYLLKVGCNKGDFVLLDPDRRTEGSRDFTLENSKPNPLLLEEEVVEKGGHLWIKHSPMMDLDKLFVAFKYLREIWVISKRNEVKEICTLHQMESNVELKVSCIIVDPKASGGGLTEVFSWEDRLCWPDIVSEYGKGYIFYEPDRSIIKSGFSGAYAQKNGLKAINRKVPYFVSTKRLSEFMGRVYEVETILPYKREELLKYFKKQGISQASISARGFIKRADELEKELNLPPGNRYFLFFYMTENGDKRVAVTLNK